MSSTSAVNLTWDFSSRRQVFAPAGKTEWKTNAPYVKSCHAAWQDTRYISVIVRSAQFTWNELPEWSAFFSQSIHPILAGLIFNIIPFFLRIFFSQFYASLKKKKSKSRRGNCLILPHANYGPGSFYKLIIDPHNNLLPVGLIALIISEFIVHSTKLLNFYWSRAIQLIPNCTL